MQYTLRNFETREMDPPPESIWSLPSSVKSFTYAKGSNYIYAITNTTVSIFIYTLYYMVIVFIIHAMQSLTRQHTHCYIKYHVDINVSS